MTDWKQKLLAFLHDPPTKPFNVADHRELAESLIRNAGLDPAEAAWFFAKVCDHTAAAADRAVCPAMKADWQAEAVAFNHPLGGGALHFEPRITADQAETMVAAAQPHVLPYDQLPADQRDWARFFCHWRLWPEWCAKKDPRLVHLPAEIRVPDHTVWTHCSVVSALQTCVRTTGAGENLQVREFKPTFLLVQIGPVQEFIAQARPTRDLWSGSYLLSWLIAHGIKAVTDSIGPDCVLFPSLRGQPLFDFLHKESLFKPLELWENTDSDGKKRKLHADEQILTPNLPNRFLAVVPEWQAKELAEAVKDAMLKELRQDISEACWSWLAKIGCPLNQDAQARWHQQIDQFLTVHWQVCPWEANVKNAMAAFKSIPAGKFPAEDRPAVTPGEALELSYNAATKGIPFSDLDPRNYRHRSWKEGEVWKSCCVDTNGNDLKSGGAPLIENPGFAWAAHYAKTEFLLAARRNTRDFELWAASDTGRLGQDKDMLSGKEEAIGDKAWRDQLASKRPWLFHSGEQLGAMNLIKRVWHAAYLEPKKGLNRLPRFDSVPAVAAASFAIETIETLADNSAAWGHFVSFQRAAMAARRHFSAAISSKSNEHEWSAETDGSVWHVTEWDRAIQDAHKAGLSKTELQAARDALHRLQGEKALNRSPLPYVAILAMDGDSMGQWVSGAKSPLLKGQLAKDAEKYFQKCEHLKKLLETPRHVSPSYHLQFSEALANFSLYLAAPIVEFFHGQLLYSGGDDVLAMLPAAEALPCARALRDAFRGDPDLWRCFDSSREFVPADSASPFLPGKSGQDGFIAVNRQAPLWQRLRLRGSLPRGYTLLVPGKNADISAGIAIGHMHTPLQNLIEAAREAEKRAKKADAKGGYGKAAFAVSLFKRSGEVQQWGAKWRQSDGSAPALELATEFARLSMADGSRPAILSNRFPYTLARLLAPYAERAGSSEFKIEAVNGFDPIQVFPREVQHAVRQHSPDGWPKGEGKAFLALIQQHLEACRSHRLDDFLGPFVTTSFLNRNEE